MIENFKIRKNTCRHETYEIPFLLEYSFLVAEVRDGKLECKFEIH